MKTAYNLICKYFFYHVLFSLTFLESHAQTYGNAKAYGNQDYNRSNTVYQPTVVENPKSSVQLLNDSTFTVGADILMNVRANAYVAILGLVQSGKTVKECNELMESRLQGLMKDLTDNGFRKEDMFVDFVTQVPTYEFEIEKKIFSKTANEVPVGFELKKNIHIRYNQNHLLDKIMLFAANYEIYDLVKVDYHIQNMEAVYDTLRSKAVGLIKKKVAQFTELNIQFKPENLKYQTMGEDLHSTYPEERYNSYTAFSNTGLKKNFKNKAELEKQVTFYYNKVNYNHYDSVIHPVIVEPVIQFSYSLKVKYSLKRK